MMSRAWNWPALFDVVLCVEVLEHIPGKGLEQACRELSRVAKSHVVIGQALPARTPASGAPPASLVAAAIRLGDTSTCLMNGGLRNSFFRSGRLA